jgi:hypothetical protein
VPRANKVPANKSAVGNYIIDNLEIRSTEKSTTVTYVCGADRPGNQTEAAKWLQRRKQTGSSAIAVSVEWRKAQGETHRGYGKFLY